MWLIPAALFGGVSFAHAQVMNVAVSPSPPLVGQPATVTVTGGSALCGAVAINYGDGTTITYPIAGLPTSQTHVWSTPGNKTVVATGQGNCTGKATTSVQVVRSNAPSHTLGTSTGSTPSMTVPMRIKSYFGLSEPGGVAAIAGESFGAERGKVVAKLKAWNGGDRSVPLVIKGWKPTLIEVEWPSDLEGVRDQMDAIVETRHANKIDRASWKVFFRAETDHKVLPMSAVEVVTCGDDGNRNSCNRKSPGHNGGCVMNPFFLGCAGSFGGQHYNCHGAIGDDRGTDEFRIALANDWTIAGVDFTKSAEGGSVGNPSPPVSTGTAKWNPRITWSVTPADIAEYCAHVHIVGPKGVPFQR